MLLQYICSRYESKSLRFAWTSMVKLRYRIMDAHVLFLWLNLLLFGLLKQENIFNNVAAIFLLVCTSNWEFEPEYRAPIHTPAGLKPEQGWKSFYSIK